MLNKMGKILGDVDIVGFPSLLQLFATARCRGFLTVYDDTRRKTIEFGPVGIRLVSGARVAKPLGNILLRTGRVTLEQLDELLAEQQKTGRPLGKIVASRKILSQAVVDSALREQAADEFCDIFTWTQARFEFRAADGEPPPPDEGPLTDVILDANVVPLLLDAACRIDELSQIRSIIPDEQLVPLRLEHPAEAHASGVDCLAMEEILPLVDGQRSVTEIVDESLYPRFTVLRTVSSLAKAGVIKINAQGKDRDPITVLGLPPAKPEERAAPVDRKVLILSDLTDLQASLSTRLRKVGYDVVAARNEADAREAFCRRPVDVMILDIPIETDEGLQLCTRLRDAAGVPFVLLTSNGSKLAARNAVASGARYVLLKPVNEARLVERISSVLRR